MTPSPDVFPDLTEAGEHALPASFFGIAPAVGLAVRVLVGDGDMTLLTDEEQQRVAAFASAKRRREFVRGRTIVRRIAADTISASPQDVALSQAPGGGLLPLQGQWHVSLTHTADLAAAAISELIVGIDAERIRPMPASMADRMLAPKESLPDVQDALLHLWTAKEAVLKALGEGLRGGGLRRVHLDWEPGGAGLLVARARVDGSVFRVAVRCYCNTNWALAVRET